MQGIAAAPITLSDLRLYYEPCQSKRGTSWFFMTGDNI